MEVEVILHLKSNSNESQVLRQDGHLAGINQRPAGGESNIRNASTAKLTGEKMNLQA